MLLYDNTIGLLYSILILTQRYSSRISPVYLAFFDGDVDDIIDHTKGMKLTEDRKGV